MAKSILGVVAAFVLFDSVIAFTIPTKELSCKSPLTSKTSLFLSGSHNEGDSNPNTMTRASFFSSTFVSTASFVAAGAFPNVASADEEILADTTTTKQKSIEGCSKNSSGKIANCVSTSNIKEIDSYMPPWTFEVSPDEAFARLKGAIVSDSSLEITEIDRDARYIKLDAQRNFKEKDELQFLVRGEDKVVVFKSAEKIEGSANDFGASSKRLDAIRQKAAVFDLMGGGLTADSYSDATMKGNGVFGQLSSFFGYQSGEGFEDVFDK